MRKRVGIPLLLLLLVASLSLVWALVLPGNNTTKNYFSGRQGVESKEINDGRSFHSAVQGDRISNEKGINRRRRAQFQARNAHITPPKLLKPVLACAFMAAPDFLPQAAQSLEQHLVMANVVTSNILVALTVIPSMFLMTSSR